MKVIIILAIILFSCNQEDKELKRAKEIIELENKKRRLDSIEYAQKIKIELARAAYERATGKKDTLTDEEWLKKAEDSFKQ